MYKNIGQLCLEKGLITEIQLKLALEHQKKTGLLLGAVLVKLGYVTNQEIMSLLEEQREWYYNEKTKKDEILSLEEDLSKLPIAIVEIIATGINPESGAEIAQLAILNVTGDDVQNKFYTNIATKKELTQSFKILHKITDVDIEKAVQFKDIVSVVSKSISNKPIFSFNLQSTLNFIIHQYEKLRLPFIHDEFYDLLTIWRRLNKDKGVGYLSLIQMAKEYKYPLSKPYNVEEAIKAVHYIYVRMIEDLKLYHKVRNRTDLEKFQDRKFKFFQPEKTNLYFIIEKAVMLKKKIKIDYFSPWSNKTTTRVIDPYELINQGNEYYLIAFCNLRKEIRWFRLDRIKNLSPLDETFERQEYDLSKRDE